MRHHIARAFGVRPTDWRLVAVLASTALALTACTAGRDREAVTRAANAIITDPPIAISQVYGGGGNASATHQNDFVELHNRMATAVSLADVSLQYTSATGTGLFGANSGQLLALSGTIPAGGYFLVKLASGGAVGLPLPAANATNTGINMSATRGGKVALVTGTAPLGCNGGSTPCTASEGRIIDLVGYGTANYFEGSVGAAPALSNTTAALRKGSGCTDSNDNAGDFDVGAPAPRNDATAPVTCGGPGRPPTVVATFPAGANNASANLVLSITFSQPVAVTPPWFSIDCTATGAVTATPSGGPTTFTLTPGTALAAGESCQVVIIASGVANLEEPLLGMAANHSFSFSVAPPVTNVGVHTVQGAAHTSPMTGQTVSVGPAVVTARKSNGFYMEDLAPDADDATSEGIFVFTGAAPAVVVGDVVTVGGLVQEFRPGCSSCSPSDSAYNNLTTTELINPSITLQSHEQPLPAPIVLGPTGRLPGQVIEDNVIGSVETSGTFDPAGDGIDFYESLEGMRVRLDDPVVVGATRAFSGGSIEIAVLARGGADASLRTPRGGIIIGAADFNPERVILENSLIASFPNVNVGDSFTGAVVGVMDHAFANYKLLVSAPLPATAASGAPPEVTTLVTESSTQLTVGSLNAENLESTNPASKFSRLASIIVTNLGSPDLLSVEEIQDNDGAANTGVVSATTTLDMLVSAVVSAGGPSYTHRQINPTNGQDGGEPGGNIRVAILFRTDRGLAFVARGAAGATTPNGIDTSLGTPHLSFSPGRIDPTNPAFANSRKPLAAELTFGGKTLFVIANHFNSKGGDQPLFGRFQPPNRSSETQRLAQANLVGDFVRGLLQADPQAAIIALGDFNDFSFSAQVGALKAAGLTDLIETLPANERYSYVFEGNSQDLDHILVSASLAPRSTFDAVHANAEFWDQVSDHDPNVVRFDFGTAPVITSTPAPNPLPGGSYVYDVDATGTPAPTFSLIQAPAGMTIDATTGLVTWTASATPGFYSVQVRADNGVGSPAIQSFTLTIQGATAVPALSGHAAALVMSLLLALGAFALGGQGRSTRTR